MRQHISGSFFASCTEIYQDHFMTLFMTFHFESFESGWRADLRLPHTPSAGVPLCVLGLLDVLVAQFRV